MYPWIVYAQEKHLEKWKGARKKNIQKLGLRVKLQDLLDCTAAS